jgi:hypothetical protein
MACIGFDLLEDNYIGVYIWFVYEIQAVKLIVNG